MMRYRALMVTGLLHMSLAGAARGAGRRASEPAHSSIGFAVRHLAISNVHGAFREFTGTIAYDEQDIARSSVRIAIRAAGIDTGIADRDTQLRSADFFNVEQFQEIAFQSAR